MANEALSLNVEQSRPSQPIGVTVISAEQPVAMTVDGTSQTVNVSLVEHDSASRQVFLTVDEGQKSVSLGTKEVRVVYVDSSGFPQYAGVTDVTPTTATQTLPTRQTMVMQDITVQPIPYYETTNSSGGYTVNIGG